MSELDRRLDFSRIATAKWGGGRRDAHGRPVLPLWVADMDFETAPAVRSALVERAEFGVYGYPQTGEEDLTPLVDWQRERHGWEIRPEWIVHTPGVINAIHTAIRVFSSPGDFVLVQPPVYHPFFRVIESTVRRVLENPLIDRGDHYEIDFEDFERKLASNRPRVFLLCSPHNPVGRVHSPEELRRMGELCQKYGVVVISDEIHGDLAAPGVAHTPYGALGEAFAASSVVCTAPSKTFNLAGLRHSSVIIPDEGLRRRFVGAMQEAGIPGPNLFALAATAAAYREGGGWLDEVRGYIQANREFAQGDVAARLTGVKAYRSEGTYFLWLDFRDTGLSGKLLESFLLEQAGVWFNAGEMFGAGGDGFARVNLACPRSLLEQALEQIGEALQSYFNTVNSAL